MNSVIPRAVFVTGASGHIGRRLIPLLLARGHSVRALVRRGSEGKVAGGCAMVVGNALQAESYADQIAPADTFIHLVGVTHPSPAKTRQFQDVDLKSIDEAARAAAGARIRNFIYLSVAQPAPIMKAYIDARRQGEAILRASGMDSTFIRPWYVLGPGRRWASSLLPFYWLFERIPSTRAGALRLGLVTSAEMAGALVSLVEDPAAGVRIVEVPQIRERGRRIHN